MQLKKYQERALDALDCFLSESVTKPHAVAYNIACQIGDPGFYASAYEPLRTLPRVPYCCLRLPTGGGKTLLGAHAVGIAHSHRVDGPQYPVALWLVPSAKIGEQTLDALKKPSHPYRQALDKAFGGNVRVLGIDERRQITPQDLASSAHVFVATIQSFRVAQAAQRNVYKDDENFEAFFKGRSLPDGLMRNEDGERTRENPRPGEISWSFANVMRLVRPIMIVDEAHNFVTGLSEETGARLDPSAIIEFTATPVRSNVIVSATAEELKAAQMIKLPIHLTQHAGWEAAIIHALQQRAGLDRIATDAKEPIRPIALYQAQARTEGAEATVDVIKAKLIEHGIAEEAIKVATGDQRELDGIDLFAEDCPVEHVITVEALREGWDCSFAYVFCSVANIQSATAVEQLLGRVLRMPFATRRPVEELNRAYAHVTGVGFHAAANKLRDTLVAMGFDERTARDEIIAQQASDAAAAVLPMPGRSPLPPVSLNSSPDLAAMPQQVRDAITVIGEGDGVSVVIDPEASDEVLDQIGETLAPLAGDGDPRPAIAAHVERRQAAATPSQKGEVFTMPGLVLEQYGELDLVEPTTLLDLAGWTLEGVEADLPGFAISETPDTVVVDVDEGQVRISRDNAQTTLQLEDETAWTASDLSRWLDRMTRQTDISQPVFLEYCRRAVVKLVEDRGFSLAALVRAKDVLRRAIAARVKELRAEAGQTGLQLLLDDIAPSLGIGDNGFTFAEGKYLPRKPYSGRYKWQKHFYPRPDDIKDDGEEYHCAIAIDEHPNVKHWVRNIVRGENAYWLPTSTDRFYPDFIAELVDGRRLVLEYKGGDRTSNDDSREKANIGARLEEISDGDIVFWMAEKSKDADFRARLDAKIGGGA
ncbi:DEAD/DEAH box helicase [Erythrobacter sp. MTPC3]|uniref:DEAD/DEAH box helicase n=1 Tax=Erythrobacter sp. MTPC3 TaxID=3056564 RepID=UPI0036F4276C